MTPRHGRIEAPKGECAFCHSKPLPKRHRRWCSTACAEEGLIRSNANFARQKVFARDKGVCAQCGVDTQVLERGSWKLRDLVWRLKLDGRYDWAEALRMAAVPYAIRSVHTWEMDHIIPVSEGGGMCGLDNLRTLCRACHRATTAGLKKRLAHERRRLKRHGIALTV